MELLAEAGLHGLLGGQPVLPSGGVLDVDLHRLAVVVAGQVHDAGDAELGPVVLRGRELR